MTIDQRIERVELQNRRLKWAMTLICMVAAGAFVLGQAAPDAVPDVIRANTNATTIMISERVADWIKEGR